MIKDGNISLFKDNEISLWNSVGSDCRYGGGKEMHATNDALYFIKRNGKSRYEMWRPEMI